MHMSEKEETSGGNLSQIPVIHHYRGSGDALSIHLRPAAPLMVGVRYLEIVARAALPSDMM